MRITFGKVVSIALTVALLFTLLPTAFVSAAVAPEFTMSVVDDNGNAVTALNPGTSAYVRIAVSGIEKIYNMRTTINATNAKFGTDPSAIKDRYAEYPALASVFEVKETLEGTVLSETSAFCGLTKQAAVSEALTPVTISEFVFADIPFTVPAETAAGTEVSFTFATGSTDTSLYIDSGVTNRYTIGHATRAITPTEVTMTVTDGSVTPPPVTETDKVQLDAPALAVAELVADEAAAIAAAKALVLAQEDMFYAILSDDSVATTPAAGIMATEVEGNYADGVVAVTITAITEGKTLVGENTVEVAVTVATPEPPVTETDKVQLVAPTTLAVAEPQVSQTAGIAAAEALVKRTDNMFYAILSDESVATTPTAGIMATEVTSTYADGVVTVTITAVSGGKTLVGANIVEVAVAIESAPVVNGPTFSLQLVNDNGRVLDTLYPGINAYVRITVSGIEKIYNMVATINATTAKFGTDPSAVKDRYAEYDALDSVFEVKETLEGTVLSKTSATLSLTKQAAVSEAKTPVTISEFVFADIPFTVPAETAPGTEVTFTFATGTGETNLYIASGAAKKYTIGHSTRPIATNEIYIDVDEEPCAITGVDLVPGFEVLPMGVDFPGFDGKVIRATIDKDMDLDGAFDTQDYTIVTDAPTEGKAYVDISSFNKMAKGTYGFDVTIVDYIKKNTVFTKEDGVTLTVGNPIPTGRVVADTTKVVEIKYGSSETSVKAQIAAREDLFKDIYTDDSRVTASYAISAENVNIFDFDSTNVNEEQTVAITGIDGVTISDGMIKVKVTPATITSIALEPAWENIPEMPAGTAFPGFDGRKIVANLDPDTSEVPTFTFDIVTNSRTEGKAYINVNNYNAASSGTYTLPVVVVSDLIAESFNGAINLTVDPAKETNKVKLTTFDLVLDNPVGDTATIIAAAENLVKSTAGLFTTTLTNGTIGSVSTSIFATSVVGEYNAEEKVVYVSIVGLGDGKMLMGENIVTVDVNNFPVITGKVTVSDTTEEVLGFTDVTPAGALVTAIKLDDEGNGGNFYASGYASYYAVTDENGDFKLELAPGTYKLHIAHAKYEYFEGELFPSRTAKWEEEITIGENENLSLGTIDLNYTFFGDNDLDGDVDSADYRMFAPKVGSSIN